MSVPMLRLTTVEHARSQYISPAAYSAGAMM
jgi:hypothetical protein